MLDAQHRLIATIEIYDWIVKIGTEAPKKGASMNEPSDGRVLCGGGRVKGLSESRI